MFRPAPTATRHTVTPVKREFGPFKVAFKARPRSIAHYLSLLNLGEGADAAIAAIRRATSRRGADDAVTVMLQDRNWRPHLVALVALHESRTASGIGDCWRAFDRGSWVAPQIAAVLSLIDPDFDSNAVRRLREGCPLVLDPADDFDSRVLEHVVRGPGRSGLRSSKNAASLYALFMKDHPGSVDGEELASDVELAALVLGDVDNSAERAIGWRTNFIDLVDARPR